MKTVPQPSPSVPEKNRFTPWWLSVIGAIVTYCSLKYVFPELKVASATLQQLFQLGPSLAPVFTIPFLLLAAKQLYDKDLPKMDNNKENEGDSEAE
ncbi:hypothetical protein [Desulforhopalus sp. IMCC35007]|uniref:hypothetical protein n=1 Tax=Desulforhopalus sp. IMCC35007 TaxID=2569543 RepID=UPI0010AECCB1|nr:hypothetical protein [Desulforhopalus sp. IMCC35007]TKB08153.1 hypothetical protein FCL48_14325 [Desulforhopalus sp. IMCC35007]